MGSADRHRGRHPADAELFGIEAAPALRQFVADLSWLLSGGVLLHCRDGCLRAMSAVHGSNHTVVETDSALTLAAASLAAFVS